jgi:hypothetical protein
MKERKGMSSHLPARAGATGAGATIATRATRATIASVTADLNVEWLGNGYGSTEQKKEGCKLHFGENGVQTGVLKAG